MEREIERGVGKERGRGKKEREGKRRGERGREGRRQRGKERGGRERERERERTKTRHVQVQRRQHHCREERRPENVVRGGVMEEVRERINPWGPFLGPESGGTNIVGWTESDPKGVPSRSGRPSNNLSPVSLVPAPFLVFSYLVTQLFSRRFHLQTPF